MTKLTEGRCVRFIDRDTGGWQVGRELEADGHADTMFGNPVFRLVKTSPGGSLVIVTEEELSPYPSEPIPTP
jgi:hypothetical protein